MVVAVDSTAPVITIDGHAGGDTINVQVGGDFTAPTATATDDVDGNVNVSSSSSVDITTAGTYSITYSSVDASGNSASLVLIVVVNTATSNTPPIAVADNFGTGTNDAIVLSFAMLLANDTDVDNDPLTILFADDWINGVAVYDSVAQTITFTPTTDFIGEATFTYTVTDGNDGGDFELVGSTTVTINISGGAVNQLPTMSISTPVSSAVSINEGDFITLSAAATDFEDGDLEGAISWNSTIDGLLGVGSAITVSNLSVGIHTISASVIDSANATVSETRIVTVVEVANPTLVNPLFDSADKVYTDLWESIVGADGMPTVAERGDVDNASTLFFSHRSYLVSAARNYTISGDIVWLNRAVAIANNYLNLRDDRYAAAGGAVFTGTQTSYRAAVQPLLSSATPAAVWSHDFIDNAVNGNPAVEGRRVQVLQNGRVLSALAEIVLAYHSHEPNGDYVAPQGAEAGMLTGSYSAITQTLLTEINRTARIFDGLWQQDITGLDLSGDENNGLWDVAGSYFYDKRQNLSSEGIDIDGVLPFNHASGMLQARLVLARFSDFDPLAVDHFNRWAAFHESVYASDDPTKANPGLSGDIFGLDAQSNAYKWPYVAYQMLGEDIDHVILTLEVYMTAYRLSLVERTLIQQLYRAVETVYPSDTDYYYDRIFEQGERYRSFWALPGVVNWLAEGTSLQENFVTLINGLRPEGTLHIRDYEAVAAYYGSEQLSQFAVPVLNTPPTIVMTGYSDGEIINLSLGATFAAPEVSANDAEDGVLTVTSNGAVDTDIEGAYTLTYSAIDTDATTVTVSLTVVVAVPSGNASPEARNNLFYTRINESIDISFGKITVNDIDEDNDQLLIVSVGAPANGEIIFDSEAKVITFTPDANFTGEASFDYSITDGQSNSSANVTVLVTSEPVISIDGFSAGETVYLTVGDTFIAPEVTAIDIEDGVRAVTSSGTVNTAEEGLYVLSYSAMDAEGYTATANLVVVVDGVGGEPAPQNSVRQYTFNHSLWEHDFDSNAVTGYWIGEFASASQTSYAWNGQFGQLDYHGIGDGENLAVGPAPQLGSTNSDDVFLSENMHFRDITIDNVIIMPSNFDQGTAPLVNSELISAAQRVVDYVVDEGTYGGQHSEAMVYIYEHWQEAQASFPLTESEWAEYHATTTQSYHQWFLHYQYQLITSRPDIDFRMIPVGPIIADILQNSSLQASGFTFSELYDDGAPHGKPEIYFLAGLITYQAMYGQMASNSYVPPVSNISPLMASEFSALNAFIWQRLNYYNTNGVRIWP
jgi:predicted RecA/RadA family phage recombinase